MNDDNKYDNKMFSFIISYLFYIHVYIYIYSSGYQDDPLIYPFKTEVQASGMNSVGKSAYCQV